MRPPIDWVERFQRPRAILELYDIPPTTDGVDARAFGIGVAELRARRQARRREVEAAARELAGEPFPFRRGERVVAAGDSITADGCSWFELIAALGRRRGIRFVNAAISGETSADLRKRAFRLAALRPDRLLIMIGTNDCLRYDGERLVSAAETARNLRALDAALRPRWIAPPLAGELAPLATARGISVRDEDLRGVAAAMRRLAPDVVEPQASPVELEDGLHPTLAGQRQIARLVLRGFG